MPSILRMLGSGRVWDNVNSAGGSVRTPATSMSGNATTPARTQNFVPGPNPEPYLGTREWKDPYRVRMPPNKLLPYVMTREPRNDLWMTVYEDPQQQRSSAQPQNLPLNTNAVGVAFAPTQIRQREQIYNAGNPQTLRTPQAYTPLQRYFNEKEPIAEFTTPSKYSHAIYTNQAQLQRGWMQREVPEPGMSVNHYGVSPAYQLSQPLNVKVKNTGSVDGHRAALTKANAPKRKRS